MINKIKTVLPTLLVLLLAGIFVFGFSNNEVKYPDGYRKWTHVKTLILEKGHPLFDAFGGIHHIYANKTAFDGYMNGKKFKDGSVIVFDLLEKVSADNAISEGSRKIVGVMEKNSKKFKSTGGWGFEGFKGDTKNRAVNDMNGQCFSCHLSQKDNDYVFSNYRK